MSQKEDNPNSESKLSCEDIRVFDSVFKRQLVNKTGPQDLKKGSSVKKAAGLGKTIGTEKNIDRPIRRIRDSSASADKTLPKDIPSSARIPNNKNHGIDRAEAGRAEGQGRSPVSEPDARRRVSSGKAPTGKTKRAIDGHLKSQNRVLVTNPSEKKEKAPQENTALEEKGVEVDSTKGEEPAIASKPVTENVAINQPNPDIEQKVDQDDIGNMNVFKTERKASTFEKIKTILQEKFGNGSFVSKVVVPVLVLIILLQFFIYNFGILGKDNPKTPSKIVNPEIIPKKTPEAVPDKTVKTATNPDPPIRAAKTPAVKRPSQKQTLKQPVPEPGSNERAPTKHLKKRPILKSPEPNTTPPPHPGETIERTHLQKQIAQNQAPKQFTSGSGHRGTTQTNPPRKQQVPKKLPGTRTIPPRLGENLNDAASQKPHVQNQPRTMTSTPQTTKAGEGQTDVTLSKTVTKTSTPKSKIQGKTASTTTSPHSNKIVARKGALYEKDGKPYPFSVYLGSYGTLDRAKDAVSMYEAKGISSYWVKVDLGKKGIWYRIFAGYFRTQKNAEAFLNKMQLKDAAIKETRYSIIIGVYSSEKELKKKSTALLQRGYSPYMIARDNGGYQLHTGAFHTKKSAEMLLNELKSSGISCLVVER